MATLLLRRRNDIMCLDHAKQRTLAKQRVMFRLIERDCHHNQSDIASLIGSSQSTIGGWARGESEMSVGAFRELCKHIPDEITSLMLEEAGKVVRSLTGEGCFDEAASAMNEYLRDHTTARADASEMGPQISPREKVVLLDRVRKVHAETGRVLAKHGSGQ